MSLPGTHPQRRRVVKESNPGLEVWNLCGHHDLQRENARPGPSLLAGDYGSGSDYCSERRSATASRHLCAVPACAERVRFRIRPPIGSQPFTPRTIGGNGWARTTDAELFRLPLYQLSYVPTKSEASVAMATNHGFQPCVRTNLRHEAQSVQPSPRPNVRFTRVTSQDGMNPYRFRSKLTATPGVKHAQCRSGRSPSSAPE